MAQYEAQKMLQLLRFCSWKARIDIVQSGLLELANKLCELSDDDQPVPNERYFVDLYSSINNALKRDGFVVKRAAYILRLLDYCGFQSWDEWKKALSDTRNYARLEKVDFDHLDTVKVAVCYPEVLQVGVKQLLTRVKSTKGYGFPIEEVVYPDETPASCAQRLVHGLNEFACIIWVLPTKWKDQPNAMKNPTWQELMDTGRIVPVWIDPDNYWATSPPLVPSLQAKVIGNMKGVLTSLLYLEEKLQERLYPDAAESGADPIEKAKTSGQHFHDNSSGFFNQGSGNQHNSIQNIGSQYINPDHSKS